VFRFGTVVRKSGLLWANGICKEKEKGCEMGRESGFTLIELIMVILVIGVLAAVAVPKFLNVQSTARQAVINGSAGELNSAGKLNSALCTANNNVPSATTGCTQITKCGDAIRLATLPNGSDNLPLTIGVGTPAPSSGTPANGELIGCTLSEVTPGSGTTAVNFYTITAGN
jgi:MSHA pilin protein MshA